MITTGTEPDGQTQIVEVKIDSGEWVNSVIILRDFLRVAIWEMVLVRCTSGTACVGNHTVTFRCLDSDIESASTEVVRTFTILRHLLKRLLQMRLL